MTLFKSRCLALVFALLASLHLPPPSSHAQAPAPAPTLPPGQGATEVDLELVLTVDVSLSMDLDEQRLQRDGYVAAFRDPLVWAAIRTGPRSRIAVTYVEWAGIVVQNTVLPWTLIDSPEAAQAFAGELERQPISRHRMTSISGALGYALRELDRNPYKAPRRAVDVSGDGPNNSGPAVTELRDLLVSRGVVINGLPLLLKVGGPNGAFDIDNLDQYYADCVIGGQGAFSIPVREKGQFAAAIRQKLILEISGLPPPAPAVIRAQAPAASEKADCLIGEKLWQRYMDGRFR